MAALPIRAPILLYLAFAVAGGCQMSPTSQLTALQTQNRVLQEQSNAQVAELDNLKTHSHQIEDKLIQAEEQLALTDQKLGVDRKKLANFQRERTALRDQFTGFVHGDVKIPSAVAAQLENFSRRHPSLQFDPQTGMAKLDADVTFDSGNAELKPQAEQVLADLAATLQAPEAREMRLMVAGHTDNQKIAGKEARQHFADNWQLSTSRRSPSPRIFTRRASPSSGWPFRASAVSSRSLPTIRLPIGAAIGASKSS